MNQEVVSYSALKQVKNRLISSPKQLKLTIHISLEHSLLIAPENHNYKEQQKRNLNLSPIFPSSSQVRNLDGNRLPVQTAVQPNRPEIPGKHRFEKNKRLGKPHQSPFRLAD